MPIRVLDKKVIAQIAAGEVVERPASVVKELVENSLDAGASQISVEVRGGGISLIRVTDNGSGIPAAEVELAFERYATSKINSLADLQSIGTLGFRGEALPSVAAVAQVEMLTCAAGESIGTYLQLEDGAVVNRRSQARTPGTTVTVRYLFRRVPARLKFLKATATENSHICQVVSQYALGFPEVSFTLLIDGRKALQTTGRGRLMDSVVEVYGAELTRQMLEIKDSSDWQSSPKVTGMVGTPAIARNSRDYLSFFVNRRWVSSRLLTWAVVEAYHGLLPSGKHPIAIIHLSLPLPEVDVNIHPTKSEVKFQNEHRVFAAVQKAVRQALIEQTPVPKIEQVAPIYASPTVHVPILEGLEKESAVNLPAAAPTFSVALPVLRVIGQVMGSYIIAEGPDGLYLIDQHAAHERILFDQVKAQRSSRQIEVQGLLEPVALEVSPRQAESLASRCADFAEYGFSLEPFGGRTYLVRAVPRLLGDKDWRAVLRELLDSLSDPRQSDWSERVAVSIACHAAVRSGQVLTDDEMRELVRQLEQTAVPHTCPHGRPTLIHLSAGQLNREFGRS